jgi:hypothetical protein
MLTTVEALAVAQSLFQTERDDARPPFGPLSRENILLSSDGTVTSKACAATPTVLEAAILLEALLPEGPLRHVPGALRYTLGRGLHEVEAPPFDSLADFSRALRRFERGGRATIVRGLWARAQDPPPVVESLWQSVGLPFAATVVAGVALIGAGEAMHVGRTPRVTFRLAVDAIDARPIVFNPPPVMLYPPPVSFVRTPTRGRVPMPPRVAAQRAAPPARHSNVFSRFVSRIRIKFDKL